MLNAAESAEALSAFVIGLKVDGSADQLPVVCLRLLTSFVAPLRIDIEK